MHATNGTAEDAAHKQKALPRRDIPSASMIKAHSSERDRIAPQPHMQLRPHREVSPCPPLPVAAAPCNMPLHLALHAALTPSTPATPTRDPQAPATDHHLHNKHSDFTMAKQYHAIFRDIWDGDLAAVQQRVLASAAVLEEREYEERITPLMYAIHRKKPAIALWLIEHRGKHDFDTADRCGRTALLPPRV